MIVQSIAALGLLLAIVGCESGFVEVDTAHATPEFAEEVVGFAGGSKLQVAADGDSDEFARAALVEVSPEMMEAADFAELVLVVGPVELEPAPATMKGSAAAPTKNPAITISFAPAEQNEAEDGAGESDAEPSDPCQSSAKVGPFELHEDGEFSAPLGREVREVIKGGRFYICANAAGGASGNVHVDGVTFVAGANQLNREWALVCHKARGTNRFFTLRLPRSALPAHLAHGDTLGECENPGSCAQSDADGDGVNNCTDECPGTAVDFVVDQWGCPVVVLVANAGADVNAVSGDAVGLHGSVQVLQGQVNPADLVWSWVQASGPAAMMQQNGPDLMVDTSGVAGELVFTLEAWAPGVQASSTDQVMVIVEAPVVVEVNAGEDVNAVSGDLVALMGGAVVVNGVASADDFVWLWEQTSGPAVGFQQNGPVLTVDTAGVIGDVTFRLTVSLVESGAVATDEVMVFVSSRPVQLTAGKWHNALLDGYGRSHMWGRDREGQTGDGSLVSGLGGVDATRFQSVVVTDGGLPFAFGENVFGSSPTPTLVPGATDVVQVAGLGNGAFMLTASMQVLGVNSGAATCALAGATSRDSSGALVAVAIPGLPQGVVEVAAGESHGCAVDEDGGGWVWGSRFGCSPRRVLTGAVDVAAGDMDVCLFLRDDGTAWSIGYNIVGQLGVGNTVSNYNTPRQVVGLTDLVDVAAGDRHSFFLKGDGTLWATGWNRYCQLGLEDSVSPVVYQFGYVIMQPVQVDLADVVAVAGGGTHSVAVTADGTVWGWGENVLGQLTRGTGTSLPVEVCMPMPLQVP